MKSPLLLLALFTLAGLVVTLRPYEVARVKEQLDALGSDRENDLCSVEPTPGNVFVFRAFGAGMAILGDHVPALVALRRSSRLNPSTEDRSDASTTRRRVRSSHT